MCLRLFTTFSTTIKQQIPTTPSANVTLYKSYRPVDLVYFSGVNPGYVKSKSLATVLAGFYRPDAIPAGESTASKPGRKHLIQSQTQANLSECRKDGP